MRFNGEIFKLTPHSSELLGFDPLQYQHLKGVTECAKVYAIYPAQNAVRMEFEHKRKEQNANSENDYGNLWIDINEFLVSSVPINITILNQILPGKHAELI